MPLFGVQFAPQSTAFQQGVGQGAQMAAKAEELRQARSKTEADVAYRNLMTESERIKQGYLAENLEAELQLNQAQAEVAQQTIPYAVLQADADARTAVSQAEIAGVQSYVAGATMFDQVYTARNQLEASNIELENSRERKKVIQEETRRYLAGADAFDLESQLGLRTSREALENFEADVEVRNQQRRVAGIQADVAELAATQALVDLTAGADFYLSDESDQLIGSLPAPVRDFIEKRKDALGDPENLTEEQKMQFSREVQEAAAVYAQSKRNEYKDKAEAYLREVTRLGSVGDGTVAPEDFDPEVQARIDRFMGAEQYDRAYQELAGYVDGIRLKQKKRTNQASAYQMGINLLSSLDEDDRLDAQRELDDMLSDPSYATGRKDVNAAKRWLLTKWAYDHEVTMEVNLREMAHLFLGSGPDGGQSGGRSTPGVERPAFPGVGGTGEGLTLPGTEEEDEQ